MREVTNGYTVPEDGCMSYRLLYRALPEFEADLHEHIHLENNILFPRAIVLEEETV
jgi:regulator of cell morphogenesis and NO signaling